MPRQRQHKTSRRALAEINVVPYIDVMLVLLVIFMITAPLLMQGVNVSLPQTSSKPLSQNDRLPMIVSVNQRGHYFLNTTAHPMQALTAQQLMSEVSMQLSKNSHRPVYVKGDRQANYGNVVIAMSLLQKAGVNDIGLITENQPTKAA